jgi:predicted kinase
MRNIWNIGVAYARQKYIASALSSDIYYIVVDVFYRPFLNSWIALMGNSKPILVLMAGLSGVGKTTLANRLSLDLHWHLTYKDGFRAKLIEEGKSEKEASWQAFEQAFDEARKVLTNEEASSVILDSSARFPSILENAQSIVDSVPNAQLKVILCYADKALRTSRREERDQPYDAEVDPDTREEYMQLFAHLPEDRLELDTAEPEGESFAKARDYLMS